MTRKLLAASLGIGAAALVAIAALVYPAYREDIRIERARATAGSEIADTPCGPIEYAAFGAGPAVLLVHGAGGGFDQTVEFARVLAQDGFRAVAMSRFGYLRTPLPADASPAAQADAHACLLDALKIERAAVIGISAGAPSSMQFALRHPKRCAALALVVPIAWAPDEARAGQPHPSVAFALALPALRSDFVFWALTKAAPSFLTRTLLATPPEDVAAAPPEERERLAAMTRLILPVSLRQEGLRNDGALVRSLPRYEVERIVAPTLVVAVRDDLYGTYASARYTSEHIPGARLVAYPTGGHLWAGHDRELRAELERFLRSARRSERRRRSAPGRELGRR
jgi:2-hydroxy-6-oxonona-2,4-dienedioate hydrolase